MSWSRVGTAVLVAGAVALGSPSTALAADFPEPSGYLVDQAGVVPDAEQQALEAELTAYAERSGHQLAVAVVATTGNDSIEDYANDLFGSWGVGSAARDDGVLIVVATDDRQLRIEVGRGLEGDLTDLEAGDIIRDDMVPPLRAGRVADAVRAGERGVRAALGDSTPDAAGDPGAQGFSGFGGGEAAPRAQSSGGIGLFPLVLVGLLAFGLLSGLGGRRRRRRRRGLLFPLFLGSGFGGGGFGGGSFGGSGGGGFGGFGGGSSGGGGASGSW